MTASKKILEIELSDLYSRCKENGYTVELTKSAKEFLVKHGYDEKFGARPLKRIVQSHVEDLIAESFIDGLIKEGDHIQVNHSTKEDKLVIKHTKK